jgi:hypothetical protein
MRTYTLYSGSKKIRIIEAESLVNAILEVPEFKETVTIRGDIAYRWMYDSVVDRSYAIELFEEM